MKNTDRTMMNLAVLRENLQKMMEPQVLTKFADLLESMNNETNSGSLLNRYKYFVEKNGTDCRYAMMAKEFFLNDNAESCAKAINWLYHNWSKNYE